jgi:hypothetical protein
MPASFLQWKNWRERVGFVHPRPLSNFNGIVVYCKNKKGILTKAFLR